MFVFSVSDVISSCTEYGFGQGSKVCTDYIVSENKKVNEHLEELEKVKATLPAAKWNAQFQQNPTAEEGSIIKREWWKIWEKY